jgi:hypothetical protein
MIVTWTVRGRVGGMKVEWATERVAHHLLVQRKPDCVQYTRTQRGPPWQSAAFLGYPTTGLWFVTRNLLDGPMTTRELEYDPEAADWDYFFARVLRGCRAARRPEPLIDWLLENLPTPLSGAVTNDDLRTPHLETDVTERPGLPGNPLGERDGEFVGG